MALSQHSVETHYAPVIGLEVHAQLSTNSKMYCGCDARYFTTSPNSHVCAVCAGMPGALPTINRRAVDLAVCTAIALQCRVPEVSKFDRKNYPYPDLPKGYQISQYDMPIGRNGWIEFGGEGARSRCRIVRVHLEEDTGKLLHPEGGETAVSLVDYNRCGVPLMEIVSEPELHSPEQAREYFVALRQILMHLGVCDGNLQEGSMRADVNVSLTSDGSALGTPVEIKNLNSFRAVHRSIEYEIGRQRSLLERGESVTRETRGWSEEREITVSQRTKEQAHDYRYFPEPDLPILRFSSSYLQSIREDLPELPLARLDRFVEDFGLTESTARTLISERAVADFYERAVATAAHATPATIAKWMTGDFARIVHASGRPIAESRCTPAHLAAVVDLVESGAINGPAGKTTIELCFESGEDPASIVSRLDLRQIDDDVALHGLIDEILAQNAPLVERYRAGKTNVIQALVGRAMQASRGKANPETVRKVLESRLSQ